MPETHRIEEVGGKWRVHFNLRKIAQDYDSEDTARSIVAADKALLEAESACLCAPVPLGDDKKLELATKLRKATDDLRKRGVEGFTIRQFDFFANLLEEG